MKNSWISPVLTTIFAGLVLCHGLAHAELKGTNLTFYSWDDNPTVQTYQNSQSSLVLDGKWHPFFATVDTFDTTEVNPAAVEQSNGAVNCSTTDTDGNGESYLTLDQLPQTRWAGKVRLSVEASSVGAGGVINGFSATRCWELAVCDREGDGIGSGFNKSDRETLPRYRRFAIDITDTEPAIEAVCPTPTANESRDYINPEASNGFITLLDRDNVQPCTQTGRCDLR
ncbi:MAG TPA: hypothetical protein VJ908_03505, partial [Wenzhouxiangellaceae bacterium]|nr:hypothetical protein [Wenzhouxiangellaceae bacterium]